MSETAVTKGALSQTQKALMIPLLPSPWPWTGPEPLGFLISVQIPKMGPLRPFIFSCSTFLHGSCCVY